MRNNSAAGSGGLRGEGVLLAQFSVFEAKRGLSHTQRCRNRQPPGPPWGAQSSLESTWSARFPFGDSPSTPRAPPWHRGSPSLCSPPVLALEDRCPGPVHPRLLSRSPGLLRPFCLRSEPASQLCTQRCPAPHTDLSSGLPSGILPLKPLLPSALLPPGALSSSPLQTWTLTPAGEKRQHTTRQETTVIVLFLQGQMYLLSERRSRYVDGKSKSLVSNCLPVFAEIAV